MIPCTRGSSFASRSAFSTSIALAISRNSYRIPSAAQARPVHSAYFLAAGSLLASRPTRRGASIPASLSFWIWFRISFRNGWAIDVASIFWAPGAHSLLAAAVVSDGIAVVVVVVGDVVL